MYSFKIELYIKWGNEMIGPRTLVEKQWCSEIGTLHILTTTLCMYDWPILRGVTTKRDTYIQSQKPTILFSNVKSLPVLQFRFDRSVIWSLLLWQIWYAVRRTQSSVLTILSRYITLQLVSLSMQINVINK